MQKGIEGTQQICPEVIFRFVFSHSIGEAILKLFLDILQNQVNSDRVRNHGFHCERRLRYRRDISVTCGNGLNLEVLV